MKFKIGDIVRILPKDDSLDYYKCGYVSKMKKYAGKVTSIVDIDNDFYELKVDDKTWSWSDDMLELYNTSDKHSFMWAVQMMKEGKKVRRETWMSQYYIRTNSNAGRIDLTNIGMENLGFMEFEATDWEIFEENVFGDFEVNDDGGIFYKKICIVEPSDLDDLEKAIKRVRELQ